MKLKNRKRKSKEKIAKKYIYDFQQYETIWSVSESIYTRKASRVEAEKDQSNLIENMVEFNDKSRPRSKEGK